MKKQARRVEIAALLGFEKHPGGSSAKDAQWLAEDPQWLVDHADYATYALRIEDLLHGSCFYWGEYEIALLFTVDMESNEFASAANNSALRRRRRSG